MRVHIWCIALLGLPTLLFGHDFEEFPSADAAHLVEFERCLIEIDDIPIVVEVAHTARQRQQGLMHRTVLPTRMGMLFVFPSPRPVSFWMKDTTLPLTVAYFNGDGILTEMHDLTPLSLDHVSSSVPVQYALELNQGEFQQLGLGIGSNLFFGCQNEYQNPEQAPEHAP